MPLTPREQPNPPSDPSSTEGSEPTASASDHKRVEHSPEEALPKLMSYNSRYQFKPSIVAEAAEGDDDEEIYKIEVRGWKVELSMMEVLTSVVPACSTITHLT